MIDNDIRTMIIDLLDDENGINSKALDKLIILAKETGNEDVVSKVELQEERGFLWEDDAEDLRNAKIVNNL